MSLTTLSCGRVGSQELRAIGARRYHACTSSIICSMAAHATKGQVRPGALNRYYYQALIPVKDARLLARLP